MGARDISFSIFGKFWATLIFRLGKQTEQQAVAAFCKSERTLVFDFLRLCQYFTLQQI